jgi:hypothetical protein
VQHDDDGWRCLVAVSFAMILEERFVEITVVANPSRCLERNRRLAATRCSFPLPMHGPMSHAQDGRGPRALHSAFGITCANLVVANENYIRTYFYLVAKIRFG